MIIISIDNGRLISASQNASDNQSFKANEKGAKKLAEYLVKNHVTSWMYSSSVDFPDEYGAPNLNFRTLIETAYEIRAYKSNYDLAKHIVDELLLQRPSWLHDCPDCVEEFEIDVVKMEKATRRALKTFAGKLFIGMTN